MTTTPQTLPRLEPGDRLTRDEFHRRYELRPDIKKAELIDGVVYVMPSPVSFPHGKPHAILITWLGTFMASQRNLELVDNATVFLPPDEEVQPDACLLRVDDPNGASVGADNYIHGSPPFVAEVATSSAHYDLVTKKDAYQRAGVQEYLVWQTRQARIDWFALSEGIYIPLAANRCGIVESRALPGLRLDVPAMLAGDLAAVLAAQRRRGRR